MTQTPHTVGILYPGEMGAAVAALLHRCGLRVVTTLRGRSATTASRARAAEIEILDSLESVARAANVVISTVPPDAAAQVASDYRAVAPLAPPGTIYVDANSIRPELAQTLARTLDTHGVTFVDAAINGLAKNLSTGGTLFLSGPRAAEIAAIFEGVARLRVLGGRPGQASAMKMLLSGLSKGVCALYVELAQLASRRDMLDEFARTCGDIYPGLVAIVDRMLPTYTRHAARRASEMRELQQTAAESVLDAPMIAAILEVHERISAVVSPAGGWKPNDLFDRLTDPPPTRRGNHGQ